MNCRAIQDPSKDLNSPILPSKENEITDLLHDHINLSCHHGHRRIGLLHPSPTRVTAFSYHISSFGSS